jgi:hypothetical protein
MTSTITTVLSTADKLKEIKNNKICSFCVDYCDEVYNQLEIGSTEKINKKYK